jgi:hypothetical protein
MKEILGDVRFSAIPYIQPLSANVKNLAKIVAAAAARRYVQDNQYITELLVSLLMTAVKQTGDFQLQKAQFAHLVPSRAIDFSSWTGAMLTYFKNYPADVVLDHFFSERSHPDDRAHAHLIKTFAKLVTRKHLDNYDIKEELFVDFIAIKHFLHRKNLFMPYLDRLESMLQEYAEDIKFRQVLHQRQDGMWSLPLTIPNIYRRHAILSDTLFTWAKANGFTHKSKVLRQLSNDAFTTLLTSLSFFKDAAIKAGENHGMWSHAIQWFAIIEHNRSNKFLQHDPLYIYKNSGLIWNHIVDEYIPYDFTSPEYITDLMAQPSAAERWPLLSGSIMRGHAKMHSPHMNYPEYLRRKHGFKDNEVRIITKPL